METRDRSRNSNTVNPNLQRKTGSDGPHKPGPSQTQNKWSISGSYIVVQMLSIMNKEAATSCSTVRLNLRPNTFSRQMFIGTTGRTGRTISDSGKGKLNSDLTNWESKLNSYVRPPPGSWWAASRSRWTGRGCSNTVRPHGGVWPDALCLRLSRTASSSPTVPNCSALSRSM